MRIEVHLINGEVLVGREEDLTEEEVEAFIDQYGDILQSSLGWRITLDLEGHSIVVPKHSVLYVEVIK